MTVWGEVPLKHLAAIPITNGLGEAGEYEERDWPRYIRTTDIAGPRRLRDDVFKSLPPAVADKARLARNDLVMVAVGATIGRSHLYGSDEPACFAGYLVRFRARAGVDPRFVAYWTESADYWQQIDSQHVKATIENFSAARYRNLKLRVPESEEQARVADFLDRETARIDELVGRRRELIRLLNLRREALLANAILGRLGTPDGMAPTGERSVPELPSTWQPARLRHVATDVAVGVVVTPAALYADEGLPFIRGFNVRRGFVTDQDLARIGFGSNALHPKSILRAGDVLVVRTGQAGAASVVPHWAVGGNCVDVLIVRCSPSLRPKFLELVLNSEPAVQQIETGSVGAIQSHFNVGALKDLVLPLPPLEEQDRVVSLVAEEDALMLRLIEAASHQVELLLEHRRAVISAATTGQIDVSGYAA